MRILPSMNPIDTITLHLVAPDGSERRHRLPRPHQPPRCADPWRDQADNLGLPRHVVVREAIAAAFDRGGKPSALRAALDHLEVGQGPKVWTKAGTVTINRLVAGEMRVSCDLIDSNFYGHIGDAANPNLSIRSTR